MKNLEHIPQLMGYSKLFIFSILFISFLSRNRADAGRKEDVMGYEAPNSALGLELEQLKSRISGLESNIAVRIRELKSKDDVIAEMERAISEKSETIAYLQREIESFWEKGAASAEQMMGKAYARATELEKQIETFDSDVQLQSRERDALESRANDAEKKARELNLNLENLQKTHEEQERISNKAESALHVAKEGVRKANLEVNSKKNELNEVHRAWLPPWIATHWVYCQDVVINHWNEHGEPSLYSLLQKASHISAQVQKQVEPYLETARSKWVPTLKKLWMTFVTHIEPYLHLAFTKILKVFEASVTVLAPHVGRARQLAEHYLLEAKECSELYIHRAATAAKPHFEKISANMKPYTEQVHCAYQGFLESAGTYHHQIQDAVQQKLRNHESTKALATEEFRWLVASALLALPVFFLYRLFSSIFCKKATKPARNANANNAHQRTKRRQREK